MKSRILISVLGSLFITLFVVGVAHASPSDLIYQNELQVVALNETTVTSEPLELQVMAPKSNTTIAAAVGTSVQSAGEIAQIAAELSATSNAKSVSTDIATDSVAEITADKSTAPAAGLTKAETEIPVKLDAKVVEKTTAGSLRDMILVFAVLAGFGLLAYLFISKFRYKNRKASQFEMRILAQHHLGPKRSLAVIRVAGESILIGLTDHHISMIKSLSLLDEELPAVDQGDFKSGFESMFKSSSGSRETENRESNPATAQDKGKKPATPSADEAVFDQDDFTISKIRDVVTRQIRNMKALE